MNLLDFFAMGGQERRRMLDDYVDDLNLERFLPPNLRPAGQFVAEANPVAAMGNAMQAGGVVFDPDATAEARKRAAVDMGVEMAMSLAPAALVRAGYLAAPAGLTEMFATPTGEVIGPMVRNAVSDVQYAGRSIAEGDLGGVLDVFRPSGQPQSVGAEAVSYDDFRTLLQENENRSRVRMYSPSLQAAEKLPQEKGTYEQLRKWMMDKGGAKADELSWSGADSVFSGKKVTKQEIIDYLSENTDLVNENVLAASGKLGVDDTSTDALVEQYIDRVFDHEVELYRNEIIPDMIEQDVRFMRVRDADADMLDELSRRTGKSVDDLLNFHDDEYIDLENSMRLRTEGYIVDTQYDAEAMARDSLYDNAYYEADRNPEQFMIDYLGRDPDDVGNVGDTEYSGYFPKGATNYQEKIYSYTDPTGKIDAGLLPNASHFDNQFDAIIGHSRTGKFPLVDESGIATNENALLVGELQSDVGQIMRKHSRLPQTYEELVARSDYNRVIDPYRSEANKARFAAESFIHDDDYRFDVNSMFSKADLNAYNAHLREKNNWVTGLLQSNDPSASVPLKQFDDYKDMSSQEYSLFSAWADENRIKKNRGRDTRVMDELASDLMSGNIKMSDVPIPMRKPMQDFLDARMNLQLAEMENVGLRDKFNRIDPDTGTRVESGTLSTSLPYVDNTSKWVDMMLRRNIYDAIKEGQGVMAVPNSEMVRKATFGSEEGQGAFYDEIVPKRFQNVVRRIDKNAKLEPMRVQTDTGVENVTGLRLTPEFIRNAAEKGIPTFAAFGAMPLLGVFDYLREQKEKRNERLGGLMGYGG